MNLEIQLNFYHWFYRIIDDHPFKIDEGKRLKIFFFLKSEPFFWGKTKLLFSLRGHQPLSTQPFTLIVSKVWRAMWKLMCKCANGQCANWTLSYNIFHPQIPENQEMMPLWGHFSKQSGGFRKKIYVQIGIAQISKRPTTHSQTATLDHFSIKVPI